MWFLITTGAVIFIFLIAYLHDYRLKTNEVKISVFENWFSDADSLSYGARFKKKGAIFWTNFIVYSTDSAKVNPDVNRSPGGFNYLRGFDYKQCVEFNNRAYEREAKAIKQRKVDRYIEF